MKKIIFVLVLMGIIFHFHKGASFGSLFETAGAFNEDGSPKIQLYIQSNCGDPCDDALAHLRYKDIDAEIFDIDKDEGAIENLRSLSTNRALPALVVGSKVFHGFSSKTYNEYMYLAKGESVLGRTGKKVYREHFYEDGSPKVVMYAVSWCGYCKKATQYFNENGIDYVEWDVEDDWDANDRFRYLESSGYPLIYVGTLRVGTFDLVKIQEALDAFDT